MPEFVSIIEMVEDGRLALLVEQHAHYSVVEFEQQGSKWRIVVEPDDYRIIGSIGHKEV